MTLPDCAGLEKAKKHTTYTWLIEDHPYPDKVYDWVRDNWHDLGDHTVTEATESLEKFAAHFDCEVDWSLGIDPSRGEYITFSAPFDLQGYSGHSLKAILHINHYFEFLAKDGIHKKFSRGECPFAGVHFDEVLLDAVWDFRSNPEELTMNQLMRRCGENLLKCIHDEGEYIYSDKGLKDFLTANEYEFLQNGIV